jgi:hypothetical protein
MSANASSHQEKSTPLASIVNTVATASKTAINLFMLIPPAIFDLPLYYTNDEKAEIYSLL